VHAVHIPNGSANGWVKIDHLLAVRRAFQLPHAVPQVLCGDFNTPQSEADGRLVTFGQTLDGRPRPRPTSTKPFTPERPWDPIAWDQGERAVLEGLPAECDMPDVFRSCHPTAVEATWVPRGRDEGRGRRLDHIFASTAFEIVSCSHLHEWRRAGLSDHSAIEATLRLVR
jgi:endonuclease/exonuclease/phosphatase family metal-dependent hydrolase